MRKRPAILLPIISNISILKRGGDIIKLFAEKNNSSTSRLLIRKIAIILDKIVLEVLLKNRKIKRLREELA